MILCDLSKAFDSVSHQILLDKLGLVNVDCFWFDDYLKNRKQSVKIGKHISDSCLIEYGVPQGSILGPILFLIYVNDMSTLDLQCTLVQYADDCQFIIKGKVENINEMTSKADHILMKAKRYFDENGLLINPQKTQCIFIGSRQNIARIPNNVHLNFEGNKIVPSLSVKNLGVHFDRFMAFDIHIEAMRKKVMGILFYLNRIKNNIPLTTRILVIQSLSLSIINYCIKIWGTTNSTQLKQVQKLQNFAARIALGNIRKYDHITPHINKLKWLKINNKYIFDVCMYIFKVTRNQLPNWLLTLPTVREYNSRITRQLNNLLVPPTRTITGEKAIEVRGPKLWNNLPEEIRNSNSLSSFKSKLKKHLLESQ